MMFFHNYAGGIDVKGTASTAAVFDGDYDSKFSNNDHLFQKRECNSDDDVSSRSHSSGAAAADKAPETKKAKKSPTATATAAGDGATIEAVKRPRGRPPGSKNKPKPPVVITRDADPSSISSSASASAAAMRPHVLEIPAGHDVIESLSLFSRRRNVGLCVLAGSGVVSNVTLRQPSVSSAAPTMTFPGRFEILSISATFFPPNFAAAVASNFSVSLAGPQGQVLGGTVAGVLMAAATVTVVAAAFSDPSYHRLPAEDDVFVSVSVSVSGSGAADVDAHHHQQQQHRAAAAAASSAAAVSAVAAAAPPQQHRRQHQPAAAGGGVPEAPGMSIYSCHLPSDVIWPPSIRPPLPY